MITKLDYNEIEEGEELPIYNIDIEETVADSEEVEPESEEEAEYAFNIFGYPVRIEKLDEKYSIRLHMREDSDHMIIGGEAPAEFDVEKNFLVHYDMFLKDPSMCGEHVRLIQMAIGLEQYNCDRTHLYAAAHGDPYATVLLGRELFLELREYSDKRDKDEEVFTKEEKERLDALLDTCLGYLRLGKKYADEKGNKTMGDIAVALFDCADAIPRFVVKSGGVPSLGRFPFPFPKKK